MTLTFLLTDGEGLSAFLEMAKKILHSFYCMAIDNLFLFWHHPFYQT